MSTPDTGSLSAFVPIPPHLSISEALSRLRTWFDNRKMQPVSFKLVADGRLGFDIGFSSETDAAVFVTFDWPRS
jgi:hypothetical protein